LVRVLVVLFVLAVLAIIAFGNVPVVLIQ